MRPSLTYLLRVLQLLLLCMVLTVSSAPARASVMIDPIVVVDQPAGEPRQQPNNESRPALRASREREVAGAPARPLCSSERWILPPGSPVYIRTCRLLR